MKLNFSSFIQNSLYGVAEMYENDNTLLFSTTSQFKSKRPIVAEEKKWFLHWKCAFLLVNRWIRYKCLCLNVWKKAAKENGRSKNPGQAHTHRAKHIQTIVRNVYLLPIQYIKIGKTALNSATCINRIWSNLSIFMCLWHSQLMHGVRASAN